MATTSSASGSSSCANSRKRRNCCSSARRLPGANSFEASRRPPCRNICGSSSVTSSATAHLLCIDLDNECCHKSVHGQVGCRCCASTPVQQCNHRRELLGECGVHDDVRDAEPITAAL